ncbi:SHD1 domain-containing protein [Pontiella sp.]|uniref:SHD1 domain-containing protein n=1 Tax=Pontiella sp. TaxID=2837462 RepID=UPI003569F78A
MKKQIGVAVLVWVALQASFAEMRIWTDQKGKSIEAEFVRTTTDKVVLRKADGLELSVSLDTLCEKDRRYAILQAPPSIDISVSINVDRENKGRTWAGGPGFQIQTESISAEMKIRKTSTAAYEAPLNAELYLIGQTEKDDFYIVLDRRVSGFRFAAENKNGYGFSSGEVSLKQLEGGTQVGIEYTGYLAVVRDKAGNVLELKTNKLDFRKNAEAIFGSERGTIFDEDFVKVVRNKDKDAAEKRQRYQFPGRRF